MGDWDRERERVPTSRESERERERVLLPERETGPLVLEIERGALLPESERERGPLLPN